MPITSILDQVSTYAKDIDDLILLIAVIVLAWFFAAELVFFGLIFKFRARDGKKAEYIDGLNPKHKRWVSWPHYSILIFDLVIVVAAVKVWMDVKQDMPPPDAEVRVIGQQWAWSFVHPGEDGKIDTPDDIRTVDELHVVVGKNYHFRLQSRDVLHSFSVPVFRLKQDVIPGREIRGWFNAKNTGVYDIQCAEMCGIGHGIMGARVFIESEAEHKDWLARMKNFPGALAPAPATPAAATVAPAKPNTDPQGESAPPANPPPTGAAADSTPPSAPAATPPADAAPAR